MSSFLQKTRTAIPVFGIFFLLFSTVYDAVFAVWGVVVFGLLCFFYFITEKQKSWNHWIDKSVYLLLFSILAIRLIGLLWSVDLSRGLKLLEKSSAFLVIPLGFALIRMERGSFLKTMTWTTRIFALFCMICLVSFFLCIFQKDIDFMYVIYNSKVNAQFLFNWIPNLQFVHPTFFSMPIVFISLLSLYLVSERHLSKIETVIYLFLFFMVIFLSGARMGLLGFALICELSALFFIRKRSWKIVSGAALIIAFLLLYILFPSQVTNVHDPIRSVLREGGMETMTERLLTGFGTGGYSEGFNNALDLASEKGMSARFRGIFHTHNQFIDETLQFGIIWTLIFLGMNVWIFMRAFKKRQYVLCIFLLTFFCYMLIESPLLMQQEIVLYCSFLCVFSTHYMISSRQ